MKEALAKGIDSAVAQEREAYAHIEYADLLKGLMIAIEKEETQMTQNELLLGHLRRTGSITMREALLDHGIQCLTKRIQEPHTGVA